MAKQTEKHVPYKDPKGKTYREMIGHSYYEDKGVDCSEDEILTKQEFKEECDINNIIKRHSQDLTDMTNRAVANYGDFTKVPDYQTARNKINAADDAFMELPAEVRKRFSNDVGELIKFLANKENDAEALKLGLKVHPEKRKATLDDVVEELKKPKEPKEKGKD